MAQLTDDCFAFGGALLSIDEVPRLIAERIGRIAGVERIAVRRADGRTLAESIVAPLAVPGFTNSAVDGYAVRFEDLERSSETRLPLLGRATAGHPLNEPLAAGTAVRIFTGAALPAGADTVMMQEDCRAEEGAVVIRPGIKRGANRRLVGEDVALGQTVLEAGRRLGAADLGLLSALGFAEVPVRRRIRVALFSTGDEVVEPGATLGAGRIFDSNRFMIACLLDRLSVDVTDLGILADRDHEVADALVEAARTHDLILTTGGVSTGEEDHVRAALEREGSLFFWRLGIKPGRPVAMGQIRRTPLVGLPGNPVAALVTFVAVARPLIEALTGTTPTRPRRFKVIADFPYAKKRDRREFVRVSLGADPSGLPRARRYPKEGAGVLTSLTETDGLVELPEDLTELAQGALVDFIPYTELV